jgi:hypothetical protein
VNLPIAFSGQIRSSVFSDKAETVPVQIGIVRDAPVLRAIAGFVLICRYLVGPPH